MGKRKRHGPGVNQGEEPIKRLKSASAGVSKAGKSVNSKLRQEKRARKVGQSHDSKRQEKLKKAEQTATIPIPPAAPKTYAQENGELSREQHSDKPRKRRKRNKAVSSPQDNQPESKQSSEPRQVNGTTQTNPDSQVVDHGAATDAKAEQHAAKHAEERAKKASRKKERADEKQQEEEKRILQTGTETKPSVAWEWVQTAGGQMLDFDPLFSQDEEHLIIPFLEHIVVYSTATSLPVRKLEVRRGHRIASIAISPSFPEQLFVLTKSGSIELWKWRDGRRLQHWPTHRNSQHLQVVESWSEDQCLIYTTQDDDGGSWQLWAHLLDRKGAGRQSSSLFTNAQEISQLRSLNCGKTICMASKDQLILGKLASGSSVSFATLSYTWHVVTCPEWISSLDVKTNRDESTHADQKHSMPFQLAIGGLKGSIHVYDDLFNKLQLHEKRTLSAGDTISRRLHWHRNAVLAVKWSKDGNYIISGGQETVLVMWQLDTDRKELLPHLGAPIESIVLSPSGAAYGIRLADNSAMILSTSEMRPTFSVAGIQMPPTAARRTLPQLITQDLLLRAKATGTLVPPACVRPLNPDRLLLAVPPNFSSRISNPPAQNAAYLQTLDISSGQELAKQAIVRTNITDLNIGPEGNLLEEPNVTHMATSCDGNWLATIEEWIPSRGDYASLAYDLESELEERILRREVFLKFWSWDEGRNIWQLVSRIDNPHPLYQGARAGRILGLVADPSMVCFATYGEDENLKVWKESARRRHGLAVQDKDGKALSDWHLRHTVSISLDEDQDEQGRPSVNMDWSLDGSVIAFAFQKHCSVPILLLDALNGKVERVLDGLYTGPLLDLAILGKYLLIMANELVVWNLVSDELQYNLNNLLPDIPLPEILKYSHIATNHEQNNFAATVPRSLTTKQGRKHIDARFAIFDPSSTQPLYATALNEPVAFLLPAKNHRGYHVIDAATNVKTLAPEASRPSIPFEVPLRETKPKKGLKNLFGDALERRKDEIIHPSESVDDRRYVSEHQILEALGANSQNALPSPEQMFENVTRLLIGRAVDVKG